MKLIHLADLHLGKKVFGYDLMEEQRDALNQVIELAKARQVDGVMIAGDVFDTPIPPVDAVALLDEFLNQLHHLQIEVMIISGNHDSGGRLDFGSGIFKESGIHIAGTWNGQVEFVDLQKNEEVVRIHLLPFLRPGIVRAALGVSCQSWNEALDLALQTVNFREDAANILMSHQFYAGGQLCESEAANVGTLDQVSTSLLEPFDYCALGHLHNPQAPGRAVNRYSGTLLKFSFSEINTQKTITLVETHPDHSVAIEEIPVIPKREMIHLKGKFADLLDKDYLRSVDREAYVYITLEDPEEIFQAYEKLREHYPRILKIEYCNLPKVHAMDDYAREIERMKNPLEIVSDFYTLQNNKDLSEDMVRQLADIWEELHETN